MSYSTVHPLSLSVQEEIIGTQTFSSPEVNGAFH